MTLSVRWSGEVCSVEEVNENGVWLCEHWCGDLMLGTTYRTHSLAAEGLETFRSDYRGGWRTYTLDEAVRKLCTSWRLRTENGETWTRR